MNTVSQYYKYAKKTYHYALLLAGAYKQNEFAEMIGVSVKTIQRWDNDGKFKAFRNPSNRRYYTHNQYVEYMGKIVHDKDKRKTSIHVFSCKIYGLRKYKNKIKDDEEIAKSLQNRN